MLKKINRNLKRADFEEILKQSKTVQTPLFGVKWIKSETESQFGWIISRKISVKAVVRNGIKRKLAEAIGRQLTKGVKMVVLVKKEAVGKKLEEIKKWWGVVNEKIGA